MLEPLQCFVWDLNCKHWHKQQQSRSGRDTSHKVSTGVGTHVVTRGRFLAHEAIQSRLQILGHVRIHHTYMRGGDETSGCDARVDPAIRLMEPDFVHILTCGTMLRVWTGISQQLRETLLDAGHMMTHPGAGRCR